MVSKATNRPTKGADEMGSKLHWNMCFVALDAETRRFLLCNTEKQAWTLTPHIADIEPCEYSQAGDYTDTMRIINHRLATRAGFHICTGKERSLIALYLHNAKKSLRYKRASCNVQSIELKMQCVLDGLLWIRDFDGKYTFECVDADDYVGSVIISINLKTIAIATQEPEIRYASR